MSTRNAKRKPQEIMENILKDIQELHSIIHTEIFSLSERIYKCEKDIENIQRKLKMR